MHNPVINVSIGGRLNDKKTKKINRIFAVINNDYDNDAKQLICYADGDITNNTRSLAYVADALKNDTEKYNTLDDDTKILVEGWASRLTIQPTE